MRSLFVLGAALALSACIPSFESVECYSDFDCPGELVCSAESTCTPARPDAGTPDGGAPDTGVTPDTGVDAGTPDTGAPDTGTPDTGVMDAGTPDTGVMDAGTPDAGPALSLSPAQVDFGVVRIGCPVPTRQVTLRNDGDTAVQVTSVDLSQATSGEFSVTGPATPLSLGPAQERVYEVAYNPIDVGVDSGGVEATWASAVAAAGVRGEGVLVSSRTDTFTQTGGPLDVLFVVDDSEGMAPFQGFLSSDLIFLFLNLAYQGWDYQIGVTSTDVSGTGARGALIGTPALISATTPNAQNTLAARLALGEAGSDDEQGMEAARLAVTGANAGWPRANAALMMVFLSNEDDHSPMMVSEYADLFEGLKGAGNEDRVAASVIVSNVTFCSVTGGDAVYAGRYLGLAPLTGGAIQPICAASYQTGLEGSPAIRRNRNFTLSAQADPSSVQVFVDGAEVDSGAGTNWSYEAANNRVVFAPALAPALGLEVRVTYFIACN
jgi:hypothetical protein